MVEEVESGQIAKIYFSYDDNLQGEELEAFNEILNKYFIQHYKINHRNNQDLVIAIIKDCSNCCSFCDEISAYNPVIIGSYQVNGLPVGITLINTGTEEEPVLEETGTAINAFNSTKYLELMSDEHTYNDEGEILTSVRPTECRPLSGFAGWVTEEF